MTVALVVTLTLLGTAVGATLGSFAGVVGDRGWRGALRGRSHCVACQRSLRWYELVPLGSYAVQRGRCRSCRAPIGWPTLVAELSGAVGGALLTLAIALVVGVR